MAVSGEMLERLTTARRAFRPVGCFVYVVVYSASGKGP
jgi:hypothetical protein